MSAAASQTRRVDREELEIIGARTYRSLNLRWGTEIGCHAAMLPPSQGALHTDQ